MKNQTISELHTDDNKSKYSIPATAEFVQKVINRKKISNEHFNICEAEISLDEIIKCINS